VNSPGTENFAFLSRDGCALIYTRDFSTFYHVSIAAALAEPSTPPKPWTVSGPLGSATPLEGFYRGAFSRNGSVQILTAEITRLRDTLRITIASADRLAPFPTAPILRDGGRLTFRTPFGPAAARFDSLFREIVGTVSDSSRAMALHLKRALKVVEPPLERQDLTFAGAGVTLAGTLVRPVAAPLIAGIVHVPGRGCVTRTGGLRLLEALAPYGVAGLAVDKRGMGRSTGDCPRATVQQFSADAQAALDQLRTRLDSTRVPIGFLGVSAGGWVSVHAAARAARPLDFLITSVGPATSVKQQQLDNVTYIGRRLGLTKEQLARARRYIDLMFETEPSQRRYDEMMATVEWAKGVGFADQFFETSDIPASVAGLDSLWVRLNDYDPAPDLRRLAMPMLAFFGESDEVVPPAENVSALRRLTSDAGNERVRIVVVPNGDHGLFHDDGVQSLEGGEPYWRFGRLSPLYLEEILRFLQTLSAWR